MHPESSLLDPEIGKTDRCFKVMDEAGMKEIGARDMLFWLEKQSRDWFKNRKSEWMRSLYVYFNRKWSDSDLDRIREMPLIRLENEEHVCVSNQLVYFPPSTDEERKEIESVLDEFPIFQSTLLEGEDSNDIKAFLINVGVREPRAEDIIHEWIIPQYSQYDKPSKKENLLHVHYLFKVWDKLSGHEHRSLREKIRKLPILQAYKGVQRETYGFVTPCDSYLPKAYTSDTNLETYFSVYDENVWFVDDVYLENNSGTKTWLRFLKKVGAADTPRVKKKNVDVNDIECRERGFRREIITRTGTETIEDCYLHGLSIILGRIRKHKEGHLSRALWYLLVKILPSGEQERNTFFQGTYSSRYRSNSSSAQNAFLLISTASSRKRLGFLTKKISFISLPSVLP